MKRKILGGLAAAAMLAGGLALSTGPAGASGANDQVCGPLDSGKIDTTGDPATVTMTAPAGNVITDYCIKAGSANQGDLNGPQYISLETPKSSITVGHPSGKDVSHYSFSYEPKPVERPEWFPPTYPPFNPEECVEYRLEKATSIWDADTGTWSEFTDWPHRGPLDWGKIPANLTGNHGGTPGEDGHRVFAYVVVDERAITTEPGEKCGPEIPEQPEPEVEIVEVVDCEAEAVRITITTTEYVYDKATNSWVLGEPTVEEKTRVLNDDEIAECTPPTTQPPTTEPPVTTQPPTTEPPVTTEPPTTEPPVTTVPETTHPAPETIVPESTQPPVTAPPASTTPPTITELPETGGALTGLIAAIAGLLTLAGVGGVTLAARRR